MTAGGSSPKTSTAKIGRFPKCSRRHWRCMTCSTVSTTVLGLPNFIASWPAVASVCGPPCPNLPGSCSCTLWNSSSRCSFCWTVWCITRYSRSLKRVPIHGINTHISERRLLETEQVRYTGIVRVYGQVDCLTWCIRHLRPARGKWVRLCPGILRTILWKWTCNGSA